MEKLYLGIRAVMLFLVIMLVIDTTAGEKAAQKMGIFILLSMLILNSNTVANYLSAVTNNLTLNTSNSNNSDSGKSSTHTSTGGYDHNTGSKGF